MRRTTIVSVVLVLAAACGAGDAGESPDTTAAPVDPEGIVLEVSSQGGFMPAGAALDTAPRYVLTADRSLYYQGPIPEMFPGPLLPNIQVTSLSESNFEEILRLIEEIGFPGFEERINDEAADQVADAATEVFRYIDESGEHVYSVYALGLGQDRDPELVLLTEILDIFDEASSNPSSDVFQGDRLQVIAGPPLDQIDPQMTTEAEWPLEVAFEEMEPFAMEHRCVVLEDGAADDAYPAFVEANQGYRWGPEGLAIHARPLIPGEAGCEVPPELQGSNG